MNDYLAWCQQNNCTHGHCPLDCEHPQPFRHPDGRFLCGRCWLVENIEAEMVACGPENCE